MVYRRDINALRAISVIAIMIFHFYPTVMPAAFAGVDIFFVISGFLITGIIVSSLDKKDFSLAGFYLSRIKRITPALTFLCLFMIVIGWFQFDPDELTVLSKHVVGAVTFVSNFMFWQESGYFDQASSDKWLLHTWSLSVEWQFYLLFPLLLLFMSNLFSLSKIVYVLAFITVSSFLLSVVFGYRYPDANFYLLPSRLWEFTLGGCVWLCTKNNMPANNRWLQWVGVSLILGSFFIPATNIQWPGIFTLAPVLGAVLVILANRTEQNLLCHGMLQRIGLWSYSIYLWHWPIMIWLDGSSASSHFGLVGIFLSIFMGFVSYNVIEKRRGRKQDVSVKDFLTSKSIHMMLIVSILGLVIYQNQGFSSRFKMDENVKRLVENRRDAEQRYKLSWREIENNHSISLCVLDNSNKTRDDILSCLKKGFTSKGFLVIGDSHGRDFLTALNLAYPDTKFNMLYQSSCAPTVYNLGSSSKRNCFAMLNDINRVFIQNNNQIQGIVFASAFLDEVGLQSFIRDIQEDKYGDVPLYLATISPMLNVPIVELVLNEGKLKSTFSLGSSNDVVMSKNEELYLLSDKVRLFDKYSVFCEEDECELIDNNYPYFWDTSHLSHTGIEKLAKSIKEQEFLVD